MITIDETKCVACGCCIAHCPREAMRTWGKLYIDTEKCTTCFGGVFHFEEGLPAKGKRRSAFSHLTCNCVERCPVGALSCTI